MDAVLCAEFVNGQNIRMIERGSRPCFLLETISPGSVGGKSRRQYFQRDAAFQTRIFRQINFAHSAFAEKFFDFVMSDFLARQIRLFFLLDKHLGGKRFGGTVEKIVGRFFKSEQGLDFTPQIFIRAAMFPEERFTFRGRNFQCRVIDFFNLF